MRTVEIDYLSLVEFDGGEKTVNSHKLANQEMNVIESLDLRDAESGYMFSGMPLKIGADRAAMRAVLIQED